MKDIYELLKQYFGYDSFRPGQEKIVRNILSGRDVSAVMPTSAGKSLCYQLPALASDGITLVISPLISLMQDQVRSLIEMGVRAAYLNSSLTPRQLALATENAAKGMYKIIYVAPERLDTQSFLSFAMNSDISLVAVDEAHCVSQWGQDFRPAYLGISEFVAKLKKRPPVAAFTATATRAVKKDIISKLGLNSPVKYTGGFDRPNLYLSVEQPFDKICRIREYLKLHPGQSGIIYCLTRKETEYAASVLSNEKCRVCAYHAGMSDDDRKRVQEEFIYDRINVIAATSAFGMGIDKPDVRFVIHLDMPSRIEDYYQQAGRAGRDGEAAECILMYSKKDVGLNRYMIEKIPENDPLSPQQREEYIKAELACLEHMIFYSTSKHTCLRKRILNYFGENVKNDCRNCSICRKDTSVLTGHIGEAAEYDEILYSKLKEHCKRLALFAGVPYYAITSETMLRELSAQKPESTEQLRRISGFGEEKIRRYGKGITDLIRKYKSGQE